MSDTSKEIDTVDWEKLGAQSCVHQFQYNYAETDNPYFVWEAIRLSGIAEVPIPEWTQNYLREVASELINGVEPDVALRLSIGRGQKPLLAQFEEMNENDLIGMAVEEKIEELKSSHGSGVKESAYQHIAVKYEISVKQARTRYEAWIKKCENDV